MTPNLSKLKNEGEKGGGRRFTFNSPTLQVEIFKICPPIKQDIRLLYLELDCQKHSQYVMRYWAPSTLYDNTVMLSHFKMHFDILYT